MYGVVVNVTDTGGASTVICPTLLVTVLDAKLTAVAVPPVTGIEGALLANLLVANFTDANPLAPASDFTASIAWGDGSAPSVGLVSGAVGGPFSVHGQHVYAEEGFYLIVTTIRDEGGSVLISAVLNATIADATLVALPTPTVLTVEGVPLVNFLVAQFNDSNLYATPSDFHALVTAWGDGTTVPVRATVVQRGPGAFDVLVSEHSIIGGGECVLSSD